MDIFPLKFERNGKFGSVCTNIGSKQGRVTWTWLSSEWCDF